MRADRVVREFVRLRQGVSRDVAVGLRCRELGSIDWNNDKETYNTFFGLDWESNSKPPKMVQKKFSVAKILRTKAPRKNGVTLLETVFGRPGGSKISDVLQLKNFCNFTNSDFEFLRYLGSAVTRTDPEDRGSFRVFALVSVEQLQRENIAFPQSASGDDKGRIILFDTADEFINTIVT